MAEGFVEGFATCMSLASPIPQQAKGQDAGDGTGSESAVRSGAGATLASVVSTSWQPESHRDTWQYIYNEDCVETHISVPLSINSKIISRK